jgi:chemosensory pili system protein ChpC
MSEDAATFAELRGVLLPLKGAQLLLPSASISEIVGYYKPTPIAGAPQWLLGLFDWHQQKVPLILFEALVQKGSAAEIGHGARVAVCKTLGGNPERPFLGVVLSSMPQLVRVTEEVIAPLSGQEELGSVVQRQVVVNNSPAWIPDLNALEWVVQEAL